MIVTKRLLCCVVLAVVAVTVPYTRAFAPFNTPGERLKQHLVTAAAFAWGCGVELLLRRFVDRRKDSDAE